MLVALFSALLGAVVGGGAASLGSMYVARAQVRRAQRSEILTVLLPRVRDAVVADHADPAPVSAACADLFRHAAAASRADFDRVWEIDVLSDQLTERARSVAEKPSTPETNMAWATERQAIRQQIYDESQVYMDWLVEQLTAVHWLWRVLHRLGLPEV